MGKIQSVKIGKFVVGLHATIRCAVLLISRFSCYFRRVDSDYGFGEITHMAIVRLAIEHHVRQLVIDRTKI